MESTEFTLCLPDTLKSCFACCPPIRPAGYEHLPYRNMIRRVLRENTLGYNREERRVHPITGFSCWALGYLDRAAQRVGCLLHPGQNSGEDLRYRVDYGDKCRRETCPEAGVFSLLPSEGRRFWLHLTEGMDSFSYSSRTANILFHLLGWGSEVLGLIASAGAGTVLRRESFFQDYPFFETAVFPKAAAYLLKRLLEEDTIRFLREPLFRTEFEALRERACDSLLPEVHLSGGDPPVHLLDLDPDFLNFLRLSLGVKRLARNEALKLKGMADKIMDDFRRTLHAGSRIKEIG